MRKSSRNVKMQKLSCHWLTRVKNLPSPLSTGMMNRGQRKRRSLTAASSSRLHTVATESNRASWYSFQISRMRAGASRSRSGSLIMLSNVRGAGKENPGRYL